MTVVADAGRGALQSRPALLLRECRFDCMAHKPATPPGASDRIDLSDQLIVQLYVHTHVLSMTHTAHREPDVTSRGRAIR